MWQTRYQFAKLLILEALLLTPELPAWLSWSLGNYPATCHTPTKCQFSFRASLSSIIEASARSLLARKFYIAFCQVTNQQVGDSVKLRIKFWMFNFVGGCDSGWGRQHFRNQSPVSCLIPPSGTVHGNSFSLLWYVSSTCSGLSLVQSAYSFNHPNPEHSLHEK